MPNADDIIDAGFAALKNAAPTRTAAQLLDKSNRLDFRARIVKSAAGFSAAAAAIVIAAIALQPKSALAAFKESARLSGLQPIMHLRLDRHVSYKTPTVPAMPQAPGMEIWRFPDRYYKTEGHSITETFKRGDKLCYDDRFATGYQAQYNPAGDFFWKFNGTMEGLVGLTENRIPKVHDVIKNGIPCLDYGIRASRPFGQSLTQDVFVDQRTKLIRFSENQMVDINGNVTKFSGTVEYPDAATADQQIPHFPKGLKFQTKEELVKDFNSVIGQPDQTKSIDGIKVTLYGVIVYPNQPDGVGIIVLTRGGGWPTYGSGNPPQIVGQPLLAAKRLDWFQPPIAASHVRFGELARINGHNYIANKSEDLMTRAPSRLTIRVPVWRPRVMARSKEGKMMPVFVGFVTFTTSKLFFNTGEGDWNFY